ncbi:MAG: DUF2807 domain-containing protein [Cyclobacteriaceae bacterium]|nr:DUF2807 domain-containing protein [Cyclobacteriaceae bacterium]
MKIQKLVFATIGFFFLSFVFTSCQKEVFGIRGVGPIVSQELEMEYFDGIDLQGAFDVVIIQGTEQSIVLEGQQNIIDRVQTNIINDIWEIKLRPAVYRHYDLTVKITSPHMDKFHLSGSGKIEIEGFDNLEVLDVNLSGSGQIISTGTLTVSNESSIALSGSGEIDLALYTNSLVSNISGSGSINFSGSARDMALKISGSGNYYAYPLESENCEVSITSSGNARVFASNTLKATITGSGNIRYKGQPNVTTNISGSGTVRAAN